MPCSWNILCSQDQSNGTLSTNVQPSIALVKLIFTELGWHFEKGGAWLDDAALEQYNADWANVKDIRKR